MSRICFPNHTGLPGAPGAPTLDGLAEHEPFFVGPDFGMGASYIDTGWAGASRITYNDSVDVDLLGTPAMSFQGLKHNSSNEIFLSFVVRRDTGFSENDAIVIAFNQGTTGKTAQSRRIDILPLDNQVSWNDAEISPTIREIYDPYTLTQQKYPDPFPGTSGFTVVVYEWDLMDNIWKDYSGAVPVPGLEIWVRTWQSGTPDYNWAVEMRVPTTGWMTLDPTFGFYFNVIRNCVGEACDLLVTPPVPGEELDGFSTQFTFPRGNYFNDSTKFSLIQYEIEDSWFGEARMGACVDFMQGLDFNGDSTSIGVDDGSSSLTNEIDRDDTNVFVAKIHNTALAGGADATGVTAEFRIANWGIGPSGPSSVDFATGKWNKVPDDPRPPTIVDDTYGNPTTPPYPRLEPGHSVDLTVNWTLDAGEKGQYGGTLSTHQCIWVRLNAGSANIVRSSMRRNMNIVPMSKYEAKAQISGVGYDATGDGSSNHDFLLITTTVPVARRVRRDQPEKKPDLQRARGEVEIPRQERPNQFLWNLLNFITLGLIERMESVEYRYVWITDGFRRIEGTFNHNGKSYALYEPADSFGFIGAHSGLVEGFSNSMQPAAGQQERLLGQTNDGRVRRIGVPDGGATDLQVELEAKEFPPGCLGLILAFFSGKLFQKIP